MHFPRASWRAGAVLLLCILPIAAQAKPKAKPTPAPVLAVPPELEGFDQFVEQALKDFESPGAALAVVKDGKLILAKGYGWRDVEKKLPMTPRSMFAIGSTTKAFTTFVMGQLVDEGKLDWDKPVNSFLPGFRLYDRVTTELITPRDLVTHRSGLPRHDLLWYNAKLTRAEMVARLAYLEPNHALRAKFQYNNAMFLTAGYLVEQITGKSWEAAVRDRIFKPLGMKRSNFSVLDSQKSDDFALPYEEREKKVVAIPFRVITNVGPAGSINSSVAEMSIWLQVQLGKGRLGTKQLISEATLADIHSPQMVTGETIERPEISQAAYGMGWFVDAYRGHQRLHHGGGIDGFSTMVTLLPQDGLGFVAFVNKSGSGLPELLIRHAADRLLHLEPIDWKGEALERRTKGREAEKEAETKKDSVRRPGTSPAHKLQEYAGEYFHPGYGVLKVELKEGHLEMSFNDIAAPLEHWHFEVFNGAKGAKEPVFENMKLQFQTDVNGDVTAVAAPFESQVKDIVFEKRPDSRLSDPAYLARFTGHYDLAGTDLDVGLAGSTLTLNIPGQPQYHLMPGLNERFTLQEYSIVSVQFEADKDGAIGALQLNQPEGVYTAKRKP